MKRTSLLSILLLLSVITTAQEIHFSQFYENSIIRNPALTGVFSGDYKAGVNYKTQWNTISVPYRTGLATVESRLKVNEVNDYFSYGISVTYDQAGSTSFNSLYVYPAINYNKCLMDERNSYLSFGIAAGYVQRSINASRMTFDDQYRFGGYDPGNTSAESIPSTKVGYLDGGAGVSFNSSMGTDNHINYYLGASAYHINKPKVSFASDEAYLRVPIKWTGSAGMHWLIDEHAVLSLHGNYSQQGINREIVAGFLACWRTLDFSAQKKLFAVYGGLFYRVKDAWIPTVKVDYQSYSFTFSYDINSSQLVKGSNGRGGFEMSVFTKGFWQKTMNKTACPRFESVNDPDF